MEFYFGGLMGTLIKFADFDIWKLFVDLAKVDSVWSYCSIAKCYKSCLFLHFACDLECRHRLLFVNTGERVDTKDAESWLQYGSSHFAQPLGKLYLGTVENHGQKMVKRRHTYVKITAKSRQNHSSLYSC